MSRIGRKPVPLPKGVTAQIDGHKITVKGPKGEISRTLHEDMIIALEDSTVVVKRPSEEAQHKSLHGRTETVRRAARGGILASRPLPRATGNQDYGDE